MQIHPSILISVVVLLLPATINAQPTAWSRLAGLEPEAEIAAAVAVLEPVCESLKTVKVAPPNFPLSRQSEMHLVCSDFGHGDLRVDGIIFTFADGRLVLAHLTGGAEALTGLATAQTENWMRFTVSWPDYLVVDSSAGEAWLMTPESAHPNLFFCSVPKEPY